MLTSQNPQKSMPSAWPGKTPKISPRKPRQSRGLPVGDNPFPIGRPNKEFSPLGDDNASPELRRNGHGQMMTLPERKVPQPSPGLLGLSYVAEPGSREVDAIPGRAG